MSDELSRLLRARTARIHKYIEEQATLAHAFTDDLLALDVEIGVQQRHNVQTQAAAVMAKPYDDLDRRVGVVERRGQQRDEQPS